VTEDLSARLVRLPLYPQMGRAIDQVISLASAQTPVIQWSDCLNGQSNGKAR